MIYPNLYTPPLLAAIVLLFWLAILVLYRDMRWAAACFIGAVLTFLFLRDVSPALAMVLIPAFTIAGIVLLPNQIYSPPPRSS